MMKSSTKTAEKLDAASKKMDSASSKLRSGKTSGGQSDQEDALDKLKDAKEDTEQEIDRYQSILTEEALLKMISRLSEMIATQESINADLAGIYIRVSAGEALTRTDRGLLAANAGDESALLDDAEEIAELIAKERSVAFTYVMETIVTDIKELHKLLAASTVDRFTVRLGGDILTNLTRLKEALEEEIRRKRDLRKKKEQGKSGKPPPPALIPPLAELILIKNLEMKINADLEELNLRIELRGGKMTAYDRLMYRRLAKKQTEITELSSKILELVKKQGR